MQEWLMEISRNTIGDYKQIGCAYVTRIIYQFRDEISIYLLHKMVLTSEKECLTVYDFASSQD